MDLFSPGMDELRTLVDARLSGWLSSRRAQLEHSAALIDEMKRLLDAGGKRLRPLFCYWGYRAAGGDHDDRIVRAAASLELLHTFAIVHDDIMDASDERRGEPTVHARQGVNVALLVGDLALVLADDLFIASGFPSEVVTRAFRTYSRMRQEVIVGQYLDIQAAHDPGIDEERARLVARLKSGRYSIEEPLAIGASLAQASERARDELAAFGAPLGEAFQLRDDLLGLFGDRSSIGKPVDSDIREGKRNVLYAKTVASLPHPDRLFFMKRWGGGRDLDTAEVLRLRGLVESSGARTDTEVLLTRLVEESAAALERASFDRQSREALRELTRLATVRHV